MGTKSNRKRNKSLRLSHSGIRRNKRTMKAKIKPIRKKPLLIPRIEKKTISSISSNSNNNYKNSSKMSIVNPSNSSSESSTVILDIPNNGNLGRGKTRKHRKGKKGRTGKRGQRGGTCYGNGVGANSYDPNFSIYNTQELQLFPYKPT
jgi:hypothetical protein